VVLPHAAPLPFVVANTDLIATLPSRIFKNLAAIPGLKVVPAPLPPVEVSRHILWRPRTQGASLIAWIRAMIKETAAKL
jgi:DNA-binding transcriptional LysR family regulator